MNDTRGTLRGASFILSLNRTNSPNHAPSWLRRDRVVVFGRESGGPPRPVAPIARVDSAADGPPLRRGRLPPSQSHPGRLRGDRRRVCLRAGAR